ncbi:MAG: hypothetical protein HOP30_08550 [Cyclobacteriaceae bacterium]|nr:hypothetical protein [Cyclobacteriaceae bacterium]
MKSSNPYIFLFTLCLTLYWSTNLVAQQAIAVDYEKAKTQLQRERERIFIDALQLSITQATVFHPIYVQFNQEKRVLDDMLISLFISYGSNYHQLNEKVMGDFVKQSEEYQRKELAVRKKYYKIISKAISVETGSQFYEVDDFISTSLRLSVLTGLPFTGRISKEQLGQ